MDYNKEFREKKLGELRFQNICAFFQVIILGVTAWVFICTLLSNFLILSENATMAHLNYRTNLVIEHSQGNIDENILNTLVDLDKANLEISTGFFARLGADVKMLSTVIVGIMVLFGSILLLNYLYPQLSKKAQRSSGKRADADA